MPVKKPEIFYNKLFINNEFVEAASGRTFPVIDPATEQVISNVSEAGPEDVDKAVAAAKAAFSSKAPWRTMDASRRGSLMHKMHSLRRGDCNVTQSSTIRLPYLQLTQPSLKYSMPVAYYPVHR